MVPLGADELVSAPLSTGIDLFSRVDQWGKGIGFEKDIEILTSFKHFYKQQNPYNWQLQNTNLDKYCQIAPKCMCKG